MGAETFDSPLPTPHSPTRFHLGRVKAGGEAVLLLSVDEPVGADVIATVEKLPGVKLVRALKF